MDDFVARQPRHPSTGTVVEFRREPGGRSDTFNAELVNLSREGFQLRLPAALNDDETIVMTITYPDDDVDAMFPAQVRWQAKDPEGGWLVGCKTSWQIDLETLGQLFLSEILATDP